MNLLLLAAFLQLPSLAGSRRLESRLQTGAPAPQGRSTILQASIISQYLNAMEVQSAAGRCVDVEVTIQARLPRLNRQAELHAMRSTSPTGRVTYRALYTWGDGMVRREVIDRYLATETQAPETNELAITPAHYRFRFIRTMEDPGEESGRRIHVFQVSPKQKRVGLFKGELWLDGQTALPVRESGRFVKSPSIFVKHIEFVRDYQIRDGVAIPGHMASTVETRLAGPAELSVQYGDSREADRECQ